MLLKYSVTLNAPLNQWRKTHSLFLQCIVKEIKAFYVLWVFFLWKGNNEEDLSVCMSSLEWPMKNMLSVIEAAGN